MIIYIWVVKHKPLKTQNSLFYFKRWDKLHAWISLTSLTHHEVMPAHSIFFVCFVSSSYFPIRRTYFNKYIEKVTLKRCTCNIISLLNEQHNLLKIDTA